MISEIRARRNRKNKDKPLSSSQNPQSTLPAIKDKSVAVVGATEEEKRTSVSTKAFPHRVVDNQISSLLVLIESDDGGRDGLLRLRIEEGDLIAAESFAVDPVREKRFGNDDRVRAGGSRIAQVERLVVLFEARSQYELDTARETRETCSREARCRWCRDRDPRWDRRAQRR